MTLWMVRGGRNGEKEEVALREGLAIVGWEEMPDMSSLADRGRLRRLLDETYPECSANTLRNWESQLWPFLRLIQPSDTVVMPLKSRPAVAIGRAGEGGYGYRYDAPPPLRHSRPVTWGEPIPRSQIDQDLLYSLGAFMTVCQIKRNDAEARIAALAAGRRTEALPPATNVTEAIAAAAESTRQIDIEALARDEIRSAIGRRFKGHKLTELVAALLRVQGYTVRQAPEGPDGGVDIIAGRGTLGFDAPRLAVQVKSSDVPSDVKVVRELQGAMGSFGAEQGLFVSWGGFRGSVEREIMRHFFAVRLWTSDDVIAAVEQHYDVLSATIQAELPLKRIWTIVADQDG